MRYGLEDRLIDFGKKALVPAQDLMTGGMLRNSMLLIPIVFFHKFILAG
jgi:hypothetical protein